jgi:hypothetical protein
VECLPLVFGDDVEEDGVYLEDEDGEEVDEEFKTFYFHLDDHEEDVCGLDVVDQV